jgi:hypothetical protein
MAGLGAKLFTAFTKLTAAQVNGYLMDQSIMRFASTAARDAAFGGAGEPTLAEGMTCYLDDTNVLQSYTGSAWVSVANNNFPYQNPSGLELVTSCTATFTGGTAGSVSNGVITVGTNNTLVTVANAFSATYDSYKIIYAGGNGTATNALNLRLGATTTNYYASYVYTAWNNSVAGEGTTTATGWNRFGRTSTTANENYGVCELISPFLAAETRMTGTALSSFDGGMFVGRLVNTTSYTEFNIAPAAGNITGGTITVYGYRK